MSDADWDYEYDQAEKIWNEACILAATKGVEIPINKRMNLSAPRIRKAKEALDWVNQQQ